MVVLLAVLAAIGGYYAWQRARYDRTASREAHGRAFADTGALALILAGLWLGGWIAPRLGLVSVDGSPGATIGVLVGVLLAGPARRAVLRRFGIDPAGLM